MAVTMGQLSGTFKAVPFILKFLASPKTGLPKEMTGGDLRVPIKR